MLRKTASGVLISPVISSPSVCPIRAIMRASSRTELPSRVLARRSSRAMSGSISLRTGPNPSSPSFVLIFARIIAAADCFGSTSIGLASPCMRVIAPDLLSQIRYFPRNTGHSGVSRENISPLEAQFGICSARDNSAV